MLIKWENFGAFLSCRLRWENTLTRDILREFHCTKYYGWCQIGTVWWLIICYIQILTVTVTAPVIYPSLRRLHNILFLSGSNFSLWPLHFWVFLIFHFKNCVASIHVHMVWYVYMHCKGFCVGWGEVLSRVNWVALLLKIKICYCVHS